MGLNYYAIPKVSDTEKKRIIEAVNIDDFDTARKLMPNRVHIGKSSVGWRFLFNYNHWVFFKPNMVDFIRFLKSCTIVDEYDRVVSYESFWQMIMTKEKLNSDFEYGTEYFGFNFSNYSVFS